MMPLHVTWPFMQWGMDIVGPLLAAIGNKKFVVVAMDYFTKWAEAEALVWIEQSDVKSFV